MIQVRNIRKHYRKKVAVDDLSFTVQTGKVTGFLGPNGAGKSTTMRLMLGLDHGTGSTLYDEKPLQSYADPAQVVGVLLEAKAFHPTRTARNHLQVLADASGIPSARVAEVLDIVGLSDVANKRPGKFSLGMSQRLGIAAAILGKPKYLLLDEPANGLDPEGIAWLRQFITDYAAQGNGVFISSHLLSEMSQMADDIVVIGKGKMIAHGSVHDLVAKSKHSAVFVRTHDQAELKKLLAKTPHPFEAEGKGLLVRGATTDEIGELLFTKSVAVLELEKRDASLEEAFLELTETATEYHAHTQVAAAKENN